MTAPKARSSLIFSFRLGNFILVFLAFALLCFFALVANLVTNFQDLVAKVKNLVALAPVLGTILRPAFPFV